MTNKSEWEPWSRHAAPVVDERCIASGRPDHKHAWRFDGDDPYVLCDYCGARRDALTGRLIAPPDRKQGLCWTSIRTEPHNHGAEGDERIRTAEQAPSTDSVYDDRCYLCGETLRYRGHLNLPSAREKRVVRVCRASDACRKRILARGVPS